MASEIPPDLSRWCPRGAGLISPPQGMTSDVVFVEGCDAPVVLKRCRDPRYTSWLRREHTVLRALPTLPVPVPRVLDSIDREAEGGDVWLVMTRLPGSPLWPWLLDASPTRRADLLNVLGTALRQVHSLALPLVLRNEQGWLDAKLAEAEGNLAWCDGTPGLLSDLVRRKPDPVQETLIHGDLSLDNVLIEGKGISGFVDWPFGGQGDPRSDIALALQTEPEIALQERDFAAFSAGYGSPLLEVDTRRWFADLYEFF